MKKSFNVVIATAGRPTLQRMIDSIAPQLEEQDYLTVIWDCEPRELRIDSKCKYISIHNPEPLGFWGHGSRNRWQDELPGDYLMNGDDDDTYHPNAMLHIRKTCVGEKLYLFQFINNSVRVPNGSNISVGNVGTSCGVYPKTGNLPRWEHVYGGDGMFYVELAKSLPVEIIRRVIYAVHGDFSGYIDEDGPGKYTCLCGGQMILCSVSGHQFVVCIKCRKEVAI
jgi:hypothetical protein